MCPLLVSGHTCICDLHAVRAGLRWVLETFSYSLLLAGTRERCNCASVCCLCRAASERPPFSSFVLRLFKTKDASSFLQSSRLDAVGAFVAFIVALFLLLVQVMFIKRCRRAAAATAVAA